MKDIQKIYVNDLLNVIDKNESVKIVKDDKLLIKMNTSDLNDETLNMLSSLKVDSIVNAINFIIIKAA